MLGLGFSLTLEYLDRQQVIVYVTFDGLVHLIQGQSKCKHFVNTYMKYFLGCTVDSQEKKIQMSHYDIKIAFYY